MTSTAPLGPLFRAVVIARQTCAIDSPPVRRAPIGKVPVTTIAAPRIASRQWQARHLGIQPATLGHAPGKFA
jgi:hypothetical protein